MSDHLGLRIGNQTGVRWLEADIEAARWGSDAAREAAERTCQAVALRCQDELRNVTVDDPDPTVAPGTATGYRTCQFEWVDETSQTVSLSWSCTRERGHQGQHLAGTGESVAAVHPSSDQQQVSSRT